MAKGKNQKLKLLYLMKLLLEKTDDKHSLSMNDIIGELACYGISAERKSIYDDLDVLRQFGIDIIGEARGKSYFYHVGKREFELAELKLLVDSVQASRFITLKKSRELIKKLEGITSCYEGKELHRQVFVAERIKTMNESIYYNVDIIHEAINSNRRILFQYFQWNVDKKMELRHNGEYYDISPWGLSWADENYYMIGYDAAVGIIKHYRVDKMRCLRLSDACRAGRQFFLELDMAVYAKKVFGMYGGKEECVKLLCKNEFAGVIIDRFGRNIPFKKVSATHFQVNVDVVVSNQFFGWIMALGDGVSIVEPDSAVKRLREEIEKMQQKYK